MKNIGILLAGGKGLRMNTPGKDKLLNCIKKTTAFRLTYEAFLGAKKIHNVVVIYRDESQKSLINKEIKIAHKNSDRSFEPIFKIGGKERFDSVYNALSVCPIGTELVFVHDCARPMIKSKTIDQLEEIASTLGSAIIARPVNDTIKIITTNKNTSEPLTTEPIDRTSLWIMQTPQVSRFDWLEEGMQFVRKKNLIPTDEVSVLESIGKKVTLLDPKYPNPKITSNSDWSYIEFLLSKK